MRPVKLELDGFGSFRQPSTVDFTDADFFALVGPTGSGKSTVVDAIVFALYGSVPRWDDRRAVGWAHAPTAGRGVVTQTFDAGPDRNLAAREQRRSAQPQDLALVMAWVLRIFHVGDRSACRHVEHAVAAECDA